ncbi:sodium:calcium antiporter [Thermus thermamylovorans]|uniref:Sodium:proton exchanger n=1 Tax=Thermus thermamylovorans TaxID=2509362 RepID=A0A4Q9B7T3_9DEIN|nr:sodium:proton exchanger [Thermus thermamylovorans]TBH21879.1 sodium:proton exchanger [Thermus thermamylovorans]
MLYLLFLLVALVVLLAGRQVAYYGDVLAEKTGLGRSFMGLFLVGVTTSLPELFHVTSAALQDLPDIAVGNLLGASMVNFLLLTLLDAVHPRPLSARAGQGHALSLGLVVLLLATAGLGLLAEGNGGRVGPFALALLPLYLLALWLSFRYARRFPRDQALEAEAYERVPLRTALLRYALGAAFLVGAAVLLPGLAGAIAEETGLGQAWVGTFMVGLVTTLPEATVVVAAARLGAVDLALGNALGSTLFNTFLLFYADLLAPGSLLAQVAPGHLVSLLVLLAMAGAVLTGLMYQSLRKLWVLAYDSWAILALYLLAAYLSLAR